MKSKLIIPKYLLLVTIAFFGIIASAQQKTGTIKGTITTSEGTPATPVSIKIKETKKNTVTDSNGEFEISNLANGTYQLTATLVGQESQKRTVTIEQGNTVTLNIQLKSSEQQLNEVVITSNKKYVAEKVSSSLRLNAELIEIPQNIMVTTRQTILDYGALNKNDMIRSVSGITKTYGNDLDSSLLIRGTDATYGTYRNGVGGPIWWNAQEDASMIERIEFVKGPAGFMLANSEPGGLVNTVTKQPTHTRINEVSFGLGSFNMMRASLDLGGELSKNGKLTYRFNTGYQQSAQFYKLGNFNRFFIAPVLKYEFDENTCLTVEHNYVKAVTAHNNFEQITINKKFFALPIDMAMNDPNVGNYLGADVYNRAHLQHKINENWKLNAQTAYMTTDWDGMSLYVNSLSPTKDTIYRTVSKSDWFGKLFNTQLFLDGKFNTGKKLEHKVLIGLDYGSGSEGSTYGGDYSNAKRLQLSINNPTYYVSKDSLRYIPADNVGSWMSTNKWQAIYVQDHLKIAEKFIITLAGRYTKLITGQDYNTAEDPEYEIATNKFTPRFGLTYLLSDKISFFGLYDESFLPQRGAVYGAGRLKPLTGSNTEFGIKGLFLNKQLVLNASFYNIKKNDVGISDPIHDSFYLQTGQVTSTGVEFDIVGQITQNLSINANYSFTNARVTKDSNPNLIGIENRGTPDQTFNSFIKYKINEGVFNGLGFGFGSQYMGKRSAVYTGWGDEFGNKYLPTYTIFDASVSYTYKKWNIGFNLYNLTNKKYVSSGYYNPDADEFIFAPGSPINFRLQTAVRF
ncbi:TonB-dependent receptor [Flavobacterium marginilacus]|uniref:TonB-dependent receptor n=1 Tax=Flavobacterium marginilacus TaxID=3003256 RepID=UPI00248DD179|nr:TonB-dependent receptor [Flavobacterium marginilacus]